MNDDRLETLQEMIDNRDDEDDDQDKPDDELQDAKFELISKEKGEFETGDEERFQYDDEGDEGLSRIEAEIERLKEELNEPDQSKYDLRINNEGHVIGVNKPETISKKEYNIARMMSKLSPEERISLRNLYKHERISKLENLKQLAEMPMLDDSYIDEETIKYLAYDEQNEDFMNKLHRVDKSGVSPFQKRAQNEANYI